jgi:hypothetical protein
VIVKLFASVVVVVLGVLGYASSQQAVPALPASVVDAPPAGRDQQRLEITEQSLTDQLNQEMDGQPLGTTPLGQATLSHLDTRLQAGQIVTTGDARVGAFSVPVSATGRIDVQDGRPVVRVQDARVSGLPLPEASRASVEQALQDQLDRQVGRMQLQVTSVTIGDGKMVVIGTPTTP